MVSSANFSQMKVGFNMKKFLLASVAALFLATGTAHATGPDECAIVLKTRDGFLNIREAPTMKSKIIAKISPADIVHDDAYETLIGEFDNPHYEGWTHIDRVLRSSGDKKWQKLRGWVGTRFLKFISYSTCHDSNL
jgi:hypothetical protein